MRDCRAGMKCAATVASAEMSVTCLTASPLTFQLFAYGGNAHEPHLPACMEPPAQCSGCGLGTGHRRQRRRCRARSAQCPADAHGAGAGPAVCAGQRPRRSIRSQSIAARPAGFGRQVCAADARQGRCRSGIGRRLAPGAEQPGDQRRRTCRPAAEHRLAASGARRVAGHGAGEAGRQRHTEAGCRSGTGRRCPRQHRAGSCSVQCNEG